MAEQLEAVTIDFVEGVSNAVISQLLSHLRKEKVLNNGEEEEIREANNIRADKARSLIDTVCKKGDEAAWKLITYLELRDPTLFKKLGLPKPPQEDGACLTKMDPTPLKKAASAVEGRQWSNTLIPCELTWWNEMKNNSEIYPVTKKSVKSRVALLIINIKFKYLKYRHGADKDERNMEKLLRDLGYEVVKYLNLTAKEMDKAVMEFSEHPRLNDTDSVFVVIMSHGKRDFILGVDWYKDQKAQEGQEDAFAIDNIFQHLASDKCKALLDKPKIIIIQACRGEGEGWAVIEDGAKALMCDNAQQERPSTSADDGNIMDDGYKVVHKEDDFIAFLSCTPDQLSYRDPQRGAFLIQYIVEVVNTYACKEHIEELFRMVILRFKNLPLGYKRQMPSKDRCTLSQRFYLFPGISHLP
ncbi:caspase-1-A-like [Festucalex cinctus]